MYSLEKTACTSIFRAPQCYLYCNLKIGFGSLVLPFNGRPLFAENGFISQGNLRKNPDANKAA
jgi:hypothetical protein